MTWRTICHTRKNDHSVLVQTQGNKLSVVHFHYKNDIAWPIEWFAVNRKSDKKIKEQIKDIIDDLLYEV